MFYGREDNCNGLLKGEEIRNGNRKIRKSRYRINSVVAVRKRGGEMVGNPKLST